MNVPIDQDLLVRLRARAAERGVDLKTHVENLVKADQSPLDESLIAQKEGLLEALQLNHGEGVGSTYYTGLQIDSDVKKQIWMRAIAEQITPTDYLRRLDTDADHS